MKIRISAPPQMKGDKYDNERLMAWLYQLSLAVNMGFSNISYDNLNKELRSDIERVINNSNGDGNG